MTTDTFAKGSCATVGIDGKTVKIAGIAKGSGMIAPDMATMLVYIFTDAKVEQARAAGAAGRDLQPELQLHHRGQRHLHLRQPDAVCYGRLWRGCNRQRRVCVLGWNGSCWTCRTRSCETVKAPKVRGNPGDRCGFGRGCQSTWNGNCQLAPGKNRHCRRGSELGPRSDGNRQVRRRRRP